MIWVQVTEAEIIKNTKALYYENIIYSYIGNVVISVNPFNNLPIYDEVSLSPDAKLKKKIKINKAS